MRFFKYVLATVTGIFAFFMLCFLMLLLVGGISSLMGGFSTEANTVVYTTFGTPIEEKGQEDPLGGFSPFGGSQETQGLDDILSNIEKAAGDPNVEGMFIELSGISGGFATVEAIRKALIDFKKEDKWVISYGEIYSQKAYYLASVADSILLNPRGLVEFQGFASERMFFKGALDKLDIEAQVFKVGDFKSAVEPFMLTKMSDENRQQVQEFLDDFYNIFLDGISEERSISAAELKTIANQAKIQNADDALSLNMVDALTYKSEALDIIRTKLGLEIDEEDEDSGKIKFTNLSAFQNADEKSEKGFSSDQIAVVYAWGGIQDGPGKNGTIGSRDYEKLIRKIRAKKKTKAIVLRVNSGGGSALASDIIWKEMQNAKDQDIPIVVSMGDVAASGGYYIACNADHIFAERNTLTGSIGVFGVLPNFQGFFNNKLGITIDTVKTAKFANIGTVSHPVNAAERAIIQNGVEEIYDIFLKRVATGRDMTVDEVHEIARGRVWSGVKAKQIGLVDELGGMEEAIAKAAELAELENYRVVDYPGKEEPWERVMKRLTGEETKERMLKQELGEFYAYYKEMKEVLNLKGVQMRIPFELRIQ